MCGPVGGVQVRTILSAIFLIHLPNGFFMNWHGTQKVEGYEYHRLAAAVAVVLLLRGAGRSRSIGH